MGLTFVNRAQRRLAVMAEFSEPACHQPGTSVNGAAILAPWKKMGWWNIDPGQSKLVYANDLDKLHADWYFHAHTDDWSITWSGAVGDFPAQVIPERFHDCHDVPYHQSTAYRVWMRELDTGSRVHFTVNLTP